MGKKSMQVLENPLHQVSLCLVGKQRGKSHSGMGKKSMQVLENPLHQFKNGRHIGPK